MFKHFDECSLARLETQVMYNIVRAVGLNNKENDPSSVSIVLVVALQGVSPTSARLVDITYASESSSCSRSQTLTGRE